MGRKKTYGDQGPEGPHQGAPGAGHGHAPEGGEANPVGRVTGPQAAPRDSGHQATGNGARVPPVHSVRCGRIRGVVWRNQGPDGEWFSISILRSYKDHSNPPVWKQTASFARDDLLVVSEVSRALWAWIVQRQATGAETSQATEASDEPIPF